MNKFLKGKCQHILVMSCSCPPFQCPPKRREKIFQYIPMTQVQTAPDFWTERMEGLRNPPYMSAKTRTTPGLWILKRDYEWDRVRVFARVEHRRA